MFYKYLLFAVLQVATCKIYAQITLGSLFEQLSNSEYTLDSDQLARYNQLKGSQLNSEVYLINIKPLQSFLINGNLRFSVPNDLTQFVAEPNIVELYDSLNYYWSGNLQFDMGTIQFQMNDGKIISRIEINGKIYRTENLGNNRYVLLLINQEAFNAECNVTTTTNIVVETNEECEDIPLRILYIYTKKAAAADLNIKGTCTMITNSINNAFFNSQIDSKKAKVQMAGFEVADLTESANIEHDLSFFRSRNFIQDLRRNYKADVVMFITDANYKGIAGLVSETYSSFENAYCLVEFDYALSSFTAAHEFGHVIGAEHQLCSDYRTDDCSNSLGINHGFAWKKTLQKRRSSIMYQLRTRTIRKLMYSNPRISIDNEKTGVEGSRDNAFFIEYNLCRVAAFFPPVPDRIELSADISGPIKSNNVTTNEWCAIIKGSDPVQSVKWDYSTNGMNYLPFGSTVCVSRQMPLNLDLYLRVTVTTVTGETTVAFHFVQNLDRIRLGDAFDLTGKTEIRDAIDPEIFHIFSDNIARFQFKSNEDIQLRVFSLDGALVHTQTFSDQNGVYNLSHLKSAYYILNYQNAEMSSNFKIFKQ